MATLVIAEKNIAGKRISEILADKGVHAERAGAPVFAYTHAGQEYFTVPLRGHIMELDFGKEFRSWYGVDLRDLVKAPIQYMASEAQIARKLEQVAKSVDTVVLATDADREGESIGFEAVRILQKANPKLAFRRAYFSAITKKDIEKAFSELQDPDRNYSDSADARREIDLIWGAALTRFLSLVSRRTGKDFLSVGRVQTPTLALIVARERERRAFVATPYWELSITCEKDAKKFQAAHKKQRFLDEKEAAAAFEKVKGAKAGHVTGVRRTKKTLKRPTPFNTTNFLRAATTIGISAGEAMNTAESLYMNGFISYPRTDNQKYPASLDLKKTVEGLAKVGPIERDAKEMLSRNKWVPSAGKETKDHPPIHPVNPANPVALSPKQWKVYELVARRFLATLADDAITEQLAVDLDVNTEPFVARGQTVLQKGWKAYYPYSSLKETILPALREGDAVKVMDPKNEGKETQPPARYSQSALIKLMEELGLGTKSTRHEIIHKLYARKYIFGSKAVEANQLAFAVIDALEKHCKRVTDPQMTADIEKQMDLIAGGKDSKEGVVDGSRARLLGIMEDLLAHKNEVAGELKEGLFADSLLGPCTKCEDGTLRMLRGRTGKRFVGCTNYPKCTNSYPLPQKGKVLWQNATCVKCGAPQIQVFGMRGRYAMCLNMECETKASWKKKSGYAKKGTWKKRGAKRAAPKAAAKATGAKRAKRKTAAKPAKGRK